MSYSKNKETKKKSWKKNIRKNKTPINKYVVLSPSIFFILTIITINKNNTAIAPKYTTINIRPKKSQPKSKKILEALKNIKIKNSTELIGFTQININMHENNIKKKKNPTINYYFKKHHHLEVIFVIY